FCTKPGTLFVPRGSGMVEALRNGALPEGSKMLNDRIREGYVQVLEGLSSNPAVQVLSQGEGPLANPPAPTLLLTEIDSLLAAPHELQTECFGPTAMVVEYSDEAQLVEA